MRTLRQYMARAVLCAMTMVVAACGGSSSGPPSTTTGSKSPLKIMTIAPINVAPGGGFAFPEIADGARAAVKAINAIGGINGHPIDLTICDNQFNSNRDAACARQAVQEHDIALVGGNSIQADHYPIIQQAGIPEIGSYGSSTQSFQNPMAFAFADGLFQALSATTVLADVAKAKRIAIITLTAIPPNIKPDAQKILALRGATLSAYVTYPIGTSDLTSVVATALASNLDGLVVESSEADNIKVITLANQLKPGLKISTSLLSSAGIQTLGSLAEGVYGASPFLPASLTSNQYVRQWDDEMRAENPQAPLDEQSADAWSAVQVFAEVARTLSTVDSASLVAALNGETNLNTFLAAPVNFTKSAVTEPGFPRAFNVRCTYDQIRNGQLVNAVDGQFVDPFTVP